MSVILANIFQVVMFTSNPHTFLGISGPAVFSLVYSQKDILELDHASICKQ